MTMMGGLWSLSWLSIIHKSAYFKLEKGPLPSSPMQVFTTSTEVISIGTKNIPIGHFYLSANCPYLLCVEKPNKRELRFYQLSEDSLVHTAVFPSANVISVAFDQIQSVVLIQLEHSSSYHYTTLDLETLPQMWWKSFELSKDLVIISDDIIF